MSYRKIVPLILTWTVVAALFSCSSREPVVLSISPLDRQQANSFVGYGAVYGQPKLTAFVSEVKDERQLEFVAEIEDQLLRPKEEPATIVQKLIELGLTKSGVLLSPSKGPTIKATLFNWEIREVSSLTYALLEGVARVKIEVVDPQGVLLFTRIYRTDLNLKQPFIPLQRIEISLQELMVSLVNKFLADPEFVRILADSQ